MMKVIIMLMMVILMLTIAVGYMGYVVYNKPVTIVINVDPAAAGQCPVEDDFKEAPSGQTHVTEHYVFEDMFQHAYVLAMSGMGEEVGNI
jgi:flagellar basal body-associated protein FliL